MKRQSVLVLVILFIAAFCPCYSAFADPTWTITQLTNNSTNDEHPSISGTNVVWEGRDGSDYEIYSNFAGQLTINDTDDQWASISGTNVVWMGWDGYDYEIYAATNDGTTINPVPVPSAVILGSLGLTFSGWLLKRKRMV